MIRSFRCKKTAQLFQDMRVKEFSAIETQARKKLLILDAMKEIKDLESPPGNHLEKLRGDREGQYSIRINSQWRVCFVWDDQGPKDVEIVDCH